MDKASEHFVHVDGRKVFYRRYGSGPAVVFLHGSPQSSRAVKPLIDAVGDGFTCIAVDTPGNGLSDPLPLVEPNAPDYADAFAKFLDALGLGRVALYGFHTGAGTAMEFLRRHPGRATCLVADGYAVWTDEERDYLLRDYLPPFDLKPDGAHLANLWSRMEEQTVFFPWFERTARGRMVYDVPSPEHIHANAMDVLNAGDNFRSPYASAFRRRGAEGLNEIQDAAVLIAAAANDPLAPHLDRLPTDLPPNFTIEKTQGDRAAALARFHDHLKAHPGDPPPTPPKAGANSDGVTHEVVKREAGGLHWSGSLGASGRPLVLLHQAGGSKRLFEPTLSKIATTRPVLAFDLPGHGDSTSIDPPSSVSDYTDAIALALSDLGVRDADICGHHLGGQIAAELGARGLAQSVGLIGAPYWSADLREDLLQNYGSASLAPVWDGAHMMRAWKLALWEALFYPWYKRDAAHMTPSRPRVEANTLHQRAVDLLKIGDGYRNAFVAQHAYDIRPALEQSKRVVGFAASSDALSTREAFAALKIEAPTDLPDNIAEWANALAAL